MGVETWNDGYVNVWEGTTERKVHLTGWGNHTVRSSNKAVTWLSIWDGAGNDDISVGALNTFVYANSGSDRYFIESGINATIYNGSGYKDVGSNYLSGSISVYETSWWSQRNIHVSAWYGYAQSGNANDTISVYGLSQAIVEDAGGNNTVHLGGGGYLKADLGWGSVKNGADTVHLYTGWNADLIKSGGSLHVYNHNYRGGNTSIWTKDSAALDNFGYYAGSAWSNKIALRVNGYADINAYGLGWNYVNLWGSDGRSRMSISSPGTNEIWATRGDDVVNVYEGGRWTEVNLDHGNDELRIHSGVNAKVTMGWGNKTIVTNYLAGDLKIYEWGWSGKKEINVRAGNVYVQTASGNDTITAFGLWSATVEDSGGNNTIDVRGSGVDVKTGAGNDSIYVSGVAAKVASGDGNDTITLDGLDARLNNSGTSGNKNVIARAGGAYIYTGSGNDKVEFYGLGTHVDTGNGSDNVTVRGIGAYVSTGAGNDTVDLHTAGATVDTGDGNDTVWSLGVGGQKVDLGNGNDTLEAYGGVNVVYAGREGTKSITVGGGLNIVQMGHGAKDKFLMVDGSTNGGDAFWKNDVQLVAGSDYIFSFWAASGSDPQPQLQLYLDGVAVGSVQTLRKASGWTRYSLSFKAGREGAQTLALKNLTTDLWGNDFGLDDIRLSSTNNMLQNGDFSQGTSGFTSDYSLKAQASGAKTAAVVDTPPSWGLGVNTGQGAAAGALDKFLMVDGSTCRTDAFWKQDVKLVAGAKYNFSFWAASGSDPQPQLQLYLDGTAVGAVQTLSKSSGWTQYNVCFTASRSGSQTLALKDLTIDSGGNDFGLDNLSLSAANLVTNGDFSRGTSGFTSDYVLHEQAAGAKTAAVVDTPPAWGMGVTTGVNAQTNTVNAFGGMNVVLTGDGNNAVNAYGGGNFLLNGNGHYIANAYGGLNVILSGLGQAEINAYGSTNIVMAGDQGNTLRAYGVGYLTGIGNLVISGEGDDRIKVGGLLAAVTTKFGVTSDEFAFDSILVMGKDAGETIEKTVLNVVSLVANAAFNAGNIVIAGNGKNRVKAYGGYNFVQTGSGNDEVSMVGGMNAAVVGNGCNRIFSIGSGNIAVAGSGDDELQAIGGANVFFANDGNNRMTALGSGNLFVSADGNDDLLAIGGSNIAIMGGGNNTALIAGSFGNLVQGGSGDDRVLALSQWNVIVLGDGNNTVGALGGGGNLVWTGSGNDTVISLGFYAGNILLLGDGDNFAISGGRANILITGSGRDSALSVGQYNLVSTANGIDNVVSIGEYNLVHTGGDDDIAAVIGKINFVDTGWGNDVAMVFGKTNILLTEAGNDTALVAGQNNYVFSGSGNDKVIVFGETNYVLTGSGHDLVAVFGKKNMVATDNEIVFNDDDLGALKESKKVKSFNDKGKDWSDKTGLDISTQAELKISADLALYFPDIEFSKPQSSDWKYPTLTLPSFSYQIPSTPALRSAPDYIYGKLGDYGIPSLSFPKLSSPQLQLPGITVPSFSIPNIEDIGVKVDQLKPNFFADFNVGSEWFGGVSSAFQSLTGLPSNSGGSSNTILGQRLNVQPKLSGDVNFNKADLTGKVTGTSQTSVNAAVASGSANADGKASASSNDGTSSSGSVFGAGNVFGAAGSGAAPGSTTGTGTSVTSTSTEYALPTLSFGDIELPNLQLNGFDFGGYSKLFADLFSGRDLYGATLPDFTLPEFRVDNFNLSDYVGGTQALTIKGATYNIPSLYLPKIAGIDYQSRLPSLRTTYQFNQGEGDVAVVGGEDNRVMTGNGDDLSLVMGKTNALFMGDGNDAGIMVGDKNAWRGGKGDDFILAAGKNNAVKGNENNDILFTLGQTNKAEGGSGDDVVISLGQTNDIDGGEGKDLMLVVGQKNKINCKAEDNTGDGDDTVLVLGQENTIKGGRGNDWLIGCGMSNTMDGGQGNDVMVAVGWENTLYGDFGTPNVGNDVMIFVGGRNKVQGNGGSDLIIGAGLGNTVEGNAGNDIVLTAGLGQIVDTGDGDDIAVAVGGGNQVSCGAGNDTLYVAGVLCNAFGGSGDDVLFALGSGNLLWGQEGNDVFLALGIASQCLASSNKLSVAVSAIEMTLSFINNISQNISGETVPSKLSAYAQSDNTNTYAYGAIGNDTFFSGFQNLIADGGDGLDTFHYYLGDGRMTVRDHSSDADKLVIHAEHLATYGSSNPITTNNLYYDNNSKTLSVIQGGKKYGDIVFDGFGTGNDQIELRNAGGSSAVALSSLSAWSEEIPSNWSPTFASSSAPSTPIVDLNTLYDSAWRSLSINSSAVIAV